MATTKEIVLSSTMLQRRATSIITIAAAVIHLIWFFLQFFFCVRLSRVFPFHFWVCHTISFNSFGRFFIRYIF